MFIIWKFLILGVLLTNMMALALPQLQAASIPYVPNTEGLARLIMNAQLSGTNSERAMKCFGDYIQISSSIGSKYSADYAACMETSRNARSSVDMEVISERNGIALAAADICQRLTHCNSMKNTLTMFNCHTEVGSNNTQSSYIITANASDFASILQEKYRTISLIEEQCFSKAERAYVDSTAGNYKSLHKCLEGNEDVPAQFESTTDRGSTTTTSSPITASTAPESSHSTEEPIKETPSTTADYYNLLNQSSSSIPEVAGQNI